MEYKPYLKILQELKTDDEEQMVIKGAMHNSGSLFFKITIEHFDKALSNGAWPISNSCLEPMILHPGPLLFIWNVSHHSLQLQKAQGQDRYPRHDKIYHRKI
jgi:hypothetical protein